MKRFLISGVPIGKGGAGLFLKNITPLAKQYGFRIIAPESHPSFGLLLQQRRCFAIIRKLFFRYLYKRIIHLIIPLIKNKIILLLHPQHFGYRLFLSLIKNNIVYFYVLDNGFFCIRSRNNNPITEKECFICQPTPHNALPECSPLPVNYQKQKNIAYLKDIKSLSSKIKFLAQNNNQKKLLEDFYGKDIWVKVVGMNPGELLDMGENDQISSFCKSPKQYDFVFHGAASIAKGIRFFISIAGLLEDNSFFVPEDKRKCENVIGQKITNSNIHFKKCNWETGLKEAVRHAKFIINPSLWSAPIEGALVKSICYNGNVITVATNCGYEQELSLPNNLLFRVSDEPVIAAKQLKQLLNDNSFFSKDIRQKWMLNFYNESNPKKLFENIGQG